jgi:hypothetical protein
MVWLMGWTSSRKLPPGLPKAIPKGRWPSLKMRVSSAEKFVLTVGEILKNNRPVNHCWLIWPSQSLLFFDGWLQLHPRPSFQAAAGGRPPGDPRTMKVLSPKTLSRVWESVE